MSMTAEGDGRGSGMSTIEKSVEVAVPVRRAYNQWTQFESFPEFMDGVEEVRQITGKLVHWRTKMAGVAREFDAEIIEQHPDRRIAWRTTDGPDQGGVVTFEPLTEGTTRVALAMEFQPEGLAEKIADATNMVERRVQRDLEHFKEYIESRGTESGAHRGSV
jgi:uncharacterized membrane protein